LIAVIFGSKMEGRLRYNNVQKINEKINLLSRLHERHRQTTDGIATKRAEK